MKYDVMTALPDEPITMSGLLQRSSFPSVYIKPAAWALRILPPAQMIAVFPLAELSDFSVMQCLAQRHYNAEEGLFPLVFARN